MIHYVNGELRVLATIVKNKIYQIFSLIVKFNLFINFLVGLENLEPNRIMGVNGSDLASFYKLANVHVHWGHNDFQGL